MRTEHSVQVCQAVHAIGDKLAEQPAQPLSTKIIVMEIHATEGHIRRHIGEQRRHGRPRQHRHCEVRIMAGQRVNHRNSHRHVAQRGETDDEQMTNGSVEGNRHDEKQCYSALLPRPVEDRIGRRVVIHLHLLIHFHVFAPCGNIGKELV